MCAKASTSTHRTWIASSQATLMATGGCMPALAFFLFILYALLSSFIKLSDQPRNITHTAHVVQHMSVKQGILLLIIVFKSLAFFKR